MKTEDRHVRVPLPLSTAVDVFEGQYGLYNASNLAMLVDLVKKDG